MDYAHSRDVVHRDIKPSNLILTVDGVVKILDMGTARFPGEMSGDINLTQSGIIMGTVNYMSPEQARDSHRVDHRTDIYSLGCTFYYLLVGECMYRGDNLIQTLLAHAEHPIPKLSELVRNAPLWLDVVFPRMVAKRPEDRFQNMGELLEELERTKPSGAENSQFSIYRSPTTTIDEPVAPVSTAPATALGIDLGTSRCAVAAASFSRPPSIILDDQGKAMTPSAIFLDGLNVKVGRSAMRLKDEKNTPIAETVRRSIGENLFPQALSDGLYPPEVLTALLLNKLSQIGRHRNENVRQTVVTVPACFDESQRKAVQDAGYIAGIETLDIINEPMAAVLDYAQSEDLFDELNSLDEPQTLLILNLGAGFCDVAVMEVKDCAVAVRAATGDAALGGSEWDDILVDFVADEVIKIGAIDPRRDATVRTQLKANCEKAKLALSTRRQTKLRFDLKGPVRVEISREKFEELSAGLLERVRQLVLQAMQDAETSFASLDVILLAGGGCRMPMVRQLMSEISGEAVDLVDVDSQAFARGAALYGQQLLAKLESRQPEFQVFDVNTHSLGVIGIDRRSRRESNAVLIPRNTHLPITTKRSFRTKREGQDSVLIQIIQGESSQPQECTRIGTCLIENLPNDQPSGSPVTVEFQYGADGRLSVYVESPTTGYRATKEIVRAGGLSNVDLQRWREWLETIMLCSDML